jgi:hypothetical protein
MIGFMPPRPHRVSKGSPCSNGSRIVPRFPTALLPSSVTESSLSPTVRKKGATSARLPSLIVLVPGGGIEPPRPRGLGILSPVRLPVPPPGRAGERYQKTGTSGTREECPPSLGLHSKSSGRPSYGGLSSVAPTLRFFLHCRSEGGWRRHPDSNRGIKDLQSSALPLGYAAVPWIIFDGRRRNPLLCSMFAPGAERRCPGRTRRCPSTRPRRERRTGDRPAGSRACRRSRPTR